MSQLIDDYEKFLRNQGKSENTILNYSRTVKRYLAACSTFHEPLNWISAERAAGASPAKLKGMKAAMVSWTNYTQGNSAGISSYKLPSPRPPQPHPVPGGVNAVMQMIDYADSFQTKLLLALGGLAGLRVKESLSVKDSSFRNSELSVYGKGDKTRIVPVSAKLAAVLDTVSEHTDKIGSFQPWVGLSDRAARNRITDIAHRCSITHMDGSNISSHDLRATFATEAYAVTGGDIVAVQRLMGHGDVNQTQTYIGIMDSRIRAAVDF